MSSLYLRRPSCRHKLAGDACSTCEMSSDGSRHSGCLWILNDRREQNSLSDRGRGCLREVQSSGKYVSRECRGSSNFRNLHGRCEDIRFDYDAGHRDVNSRINYIKSRRKSLVYVYILAPMAGRQILLIKDQSLHSFLTC